MFRPLFYLIRPHSTSRCALLEGLGDGHGGGSGGHNGGDDDYNYLLLLNGRAQIASTKPLPPSHPHAHTSP